MCFDPTATPPAPPVTGRKADLQRARLRAPDGNEFAATVALTSLKSAPGIVILPDLRGLHPYYERLAELIADAGAHAVAIDLFGRTAGPHHRTSDFDFQQHMAAATDEGIAEDVSGAVAELNRRGVSQLFVLGFCFGGRAALMQASRPDLAGVVGFYGWPLKRAAGDGASPADLAREKKMVSPVLAFFGGADENIPTDDARTFEEALREGEVKHEVVVYPGAPHSFFDRQMGEHSEACADAWERILRFTGGADSTEPA